jgi:DNA-binding NtrC family response regulator
VKILIVDDDPLQVKLLVDIFTLNHFSAVGAQSGMEALRILTTEHFDVVLSDIRMPNMDGVELCRKVKIFNPGINVVLMTAYADDELVMDGVRAGALITFSKPLDIDQLVRRLQVIIPHKNRFIEESSGYGGL